jgi:hypothetical protein
MSAEDYNQMSSSEKQKEDWMNSKWRPMCGWMYMAVCMFDFMVAPVLWSLTQALFHGGVNVQWQPLTLQGAGLFHIAMGAVLGIAAYGRTQEKLNGANNGGLTQPVGTTYVPPTSNGGVNSAPPTPSFGSAPLGGNSASTFGGNSNQFTTTPNSGFGSIPPAPSFGASTVADTVTPTSTAQVVTGFGGKPAPIQPAQPIL